MASQNDDYGLDGLDIDRIFTKALETVKRNQGKKHIESSNPFYEYDNPAYNPGMFLETHCNQAKIHNYSEMEKLLKEFCNKYSSDAIVTSAGKSEGYGNPKNALDIWALQIPATEKPEQTGFFVAGHHPEFSGPETVYLIAERLLLSYHSGNENVKRSESVHKQALFNRISTGVEYRLRARSLSSPKMTGTQNHTGRGQLSLLRSLEKC